MTTEPYAPNPDASLWSDAAVALVEYACGGAAGRTKDDPVYLAVVEHRDVPPFRARYSSCGDLAHWLLERLGLDEPWVNRASLGHYHVGANVSALAGCPVHRAPGSADWVPRPGDILEIWNAAGGADAHVCVYLGPGSTPAHARIGNYGAGGMSAAASPGANIRDTVLTYQAVGWVLGLRKVQRVIPLAAAVLLSRRPPNLTGAAVTGELIDALQAVWKPTTAADEGGPAA
jgi:hypothetical protein